MAIKIDSIQNLQQIEVAVAGPDGANRLFIVTGQFDVQLISQGQSTPQKETFTVLIGPVLTRQQFYRAIATASLAKTSSHWASGDYEIGQNWGITLVDADWDDESGQVELRIEVFLNSSGIGSRVGIEGLSFQCTILGAIAT